MNLTQLEGEIARLLSDTSNDRWSLNVLTTRINIAQQVIQGQTNAVKTSESIVLIPQTASYSLNASTMDIIRVYKVYTDGSVRPLQGIEREQLDYRYPDWSQWNQGEPMFFYYDASLQTINIAPKPDSSVGSILVYESRKPADLVNQTDIPFDSNNQMVPYHITICHWVAAQCFLDDGTDAALTKSKFHRSGSMTKPGEYEKQIGRIQAEFDVAEDVPESIMWSPTGGRRGYVYFPGKSNPFIF